MAKAKFPKMKAPGGSKGGGRGGGGGSRMPKGSDGASQLPSQARGGLKQQRGGSKGRPAMNTDGYPPQKGGAEFESDILGGVTYYSEQDGQTYHGQEAIDMYERDHPGENGPHDGITGESGMYWGDGQWNPSGGGGGAGAGADDQQGRWSGARSGGGWA